MSHNNLTPAKYAQQLAAAKELHSNPAATLDDLFRVADALGIPADELMRMREAK